jgi:hypothetical protein
MSDKVASGSDDGNFFVWDKISGRLEGIWEGDGDTVNGEIRCLGLHPLRTNADGAVMEQHPTLPLVAVSGIDNTIKVREILRFRSKFNGAFDLTNTDVRSIIHSTPTFQVHDPYFRPGRHRPEEPRAAARRSTYV